MRTLEEAIASLPPKRQALIKAKATRLIRTQMLNQLRVVARKAQQDVAAATGIVERNSARIEPRGSMLLSILQTHVSDLGGRLRLLAEFPSMDPVELDFTGRPV